MFNILNLMRKTFERRREFLKNKQVSGSAILSKFKHFISFGGQVVSICVLLFPLSIFYVPFMINSHFCADFTRIFFDASWERKLICKGLRIQPHAETPKTRERK